MSQPTVAAYSPVPGPSDRVHFDRMQARQRRAARWYAVLGLIAVAAAGVPVSLVVTPVLFVAGLLAVRAAGLFVTIPPAVPALAQYIELTVRSALAKALILQWPSLDTRAALWLFLPGAAAMLCLWIFVWRMVARVGTGGSLLALKARDTSGSDFEVHQLGNTVGEMAIAAGLRPPRLALLEVQPANAAAAGTGVGDATVIVSRGLLDRLDRDETQAVVGHLIASIGNGDLTASALLLSVQQTLGLLILVLNAPFGARSRGVLRGLLGRRGPEDDPAAAECLSGAPLDEDDDAARQIKAIGRGSPLQTITRVLLFPLMFVALTARVTAVVVVTALCGPLFSALWRRRRRLADAMAVQLTRNPDALARALASLSSCEHHVEGALGCAHLFVVWQPDQSGRHLSRVFGGLGTLSPSLSRRLDALRRMGAGSVAPAHRTWRWRDLMSGPSRTLLFVFPALVLVGGYAAALAVFVMVTFNFLLLGLLLIVTNDLVGILARLISLLAGR